ncbi:MAG: hypothetical protein E7591_02945 [Ruminococcaceae bacterium]|nr:hypothetical protein [Oscillospiraceae bacterium]
MNIGLVLSGGMAKGAYQIGALKALQNYLPGNTIKYISCASVGVLNGYAYAADRLTLAEDIWRGICTNDNEKYTITRLLKLDKADSIAQALTKDSLVLENEFYTTLLDLKKKKLIYKNLQGTKTDILTDYLRASVAVPLYKRSIRAEGTDYHDGAAVDNIPVYPLLQHEPDYIICIYFDDISYKFESPDFDSKIIRITFPPKTRFKESVLFTKKSIDDMITEGYERSERILSRVFENGTRDIEKILSEAKKLSEAYESIPRLTGDVMVDNMNKLFKKLTKKSIEP